MPQRTALVFVNAASRHGATDLTPAIEALEAGGVRILDPRPADIGELRRVLERRAELDIAIIAGGDGTLNGAAETLIRSALTLGILPLGTANDDGVLDLVSLAPQGFWGLIIDLPTLRWGWHRNGGRVRHWRCRALEIRTARPIPINIDGEVTTRTPAKIDVFPRALPVLVPQTFPSAQTAEHVADSPVQTDGQGGIEPSARS